MKSTIAAIALFASSAFALPTPVASSAAAVSSAAVVSSAAPTPSSSSAPTAMQAVDSVILNIDDWQTDIANVNTFLDNAAAGLAAPGTVDFVSGAQSVIGNGAGQGPAGTASDEPTRLMNLQALLAPGDGNAQAAAADLGNIFGGVLTNLQTIIDSNNDLDTVQTAVNAINDLRCNQVLPDISELWNGVVTDNPGAPLPPPTAVGPAVCPQPTIAALPITPNSQ